MATLKSKQQGTDDGVGSLKMKSNKARSQIVVALGWVCMLLAVLARRTAADAKPDTPSAAPKVSPVVKYDLKNADRSHFLTDGSIVWANHDVLQLKPGGSVMLRIETGPRLRVEADVENASVPCQFLIEIRLQDQAKYVIHCEQRETDSVECSFGYLAPRETPKNIRPIRTLRIPSREFDANHWKLEFSWGLVGMNGHAAYRDRESSNVVGVRVEVLEGNLTLQSIAVDAVPRIRIGAEQQLQLSQAQELENSFANFINQQEFHQAAKTGKELRDLRRAALGPFHIDTLRSTANLAIPMFQLKDHDSAQTLLQDALDQSESVLGRMHPLRGKLLLMKANAVASKRRSDEFIDLNSQAFAILKSYSGPSDQVYRQRLQQLANLYFSKQQFAKSLTLYREQSVINRQRHGSRSPQYAASISYLGASHRGLGNLDQAEPLLKQALEIYQQTLGETHAVVAQAATNVAAICTDRGDFQAALPYCQQAVAILQSAGKSETREFAKTLVDLLTIYQELGDYDAALKISEQAIRLAHDVFGSQHNEHVRGLRAAAKAYMSKELPIEALKYHEQIVRLTEQTVGDRHFDYAQYLSELADCQMQLADFATAESNYRAAITLFEALDKTETRSYTNSLLALSDLDIVKARYAQASDLIEKTLTTLEKRSGRNTIDYALSLRRQAKALDQSGRTRLAFEKYQESLRITENIEGKLSASYANGLDRLGQHFELKGEYVKALELFEQALALKKELLGKGHLSFLATQNNLALLHASLGNYDLAEQLFLEAIEIAKPISIARDNPLLLVTKTSNLGQLYLQMGRYKEAEETLNMALDMSESVFGINHSNYARQLGSLAALKIEIGDYLAAFQLFERARSILANTIGVEHLEYARSLFHLAIANGLVGELDRKETLLLESISIVRAIYDDQHPDCVRYSDELANVYYSRGEVIRAEQLIVANRDRRRAIYGDQHPQYADSLFDLGVLKFHTGELDTANKLFQQTGEIFRNAYGAQHPRYIATRQEQYKIARCRGDIGMALPIAQQVVVGMLDAGESVLPIFSDAESRSWLRRNHPPIGMLLSAERQSRQISDKTLYDHVWRCRGISTRMHASRRPSEGESQEVQSARRELALVRNQLAFFYQTKGAQVPADSLQNTIDEITQLKEQLEKQLAKISLQSEITFGIRDSVPQDLAMLLPTDAAVIDFVRSEYFVQSKNTNAQRSDSAGAGKLISEYHYDAFVLSNNGDSEYDVTWIPLGVSEVVDREVKQWLTFFREGKGDGSSGTRLRQHVWEPIWERINDKKQVIIIPDGELTVLPWSALPGKTTGKYLLEEMNISVASTGHELISCIRSKSTTNENIVLVGDIDYDRRTEFPVNDSTKKLTMNIQPLRASNGNHWNSLPFTKHEIDEVAKIWSQTQPTSPIMITGSRVGETMLARYLQSVSHVHMATHGFFALELESTSLSDDSIGLAVRDRTHVRNPFLRSGLVLSGANRKSHWDNSATVPGEDGVLLAEEVASLDLSHTKLVVLSSCESGRGTMVHSEGVFGLQRAFHQAGVKTTIASLWQVDDRVTKHLMVRFYENLIKKNMRPYEALQIAQRWILNNPEELGTLRGPGAIVKARTATTARTSPRFWAPWILSGDPGLIPKNEN